MSHAAGNVQTRCRFTTCMQIFLGICAIAASSEPTFAVFEVTGPTTGQEFVQNGLITVTWETNQTGNLTVFYNADVTTKSVDSPLGTFPASARSASFFVRNHGYEGCSFDIYDAGNTTRLAWGFEPSGNSRFYVSGSFSDAFRIKEPAITMTSQPTQTYRFGQKFRLGWQTTGFGDQAWLTESYWLTRVAKRGYIGLSISSDQGVSWQTWFSFAENSGGFDFRFVDRGDKGDTISVYTAESEAQEVFAAKVGVPLMLRLQAGTTPVYATTTFFTVYPDGGLTRQKLRGTVGKRVKFRVRGMEPNAKMRGKLPRGLHYKLSRNMIVGRPSKVGTQRVSFVDANAGKVAVRVVIRALRQAQGLPPAKSDKSVSISE